MGRTCKLNPELHKEIIQYIRNGNHAKTAAQACGICEETFYHWIRMGKKAKSGKYYEFYESIKKAKSLAIADAVKNIKETAKTKWTAEAWWLERKNPEQWGNRQYQKVEHSGKVSIETLREWLKEDDTE